MISRGSPSYSETGESGFCGDASMIRNPIHIENGRLLIRSLKMQDLDGLTAMRCDKRIYRHEPAYLAELQGTPEKSLEMIMHMDLNRDRQIILSVYKKTDSPVFVGLAEFYDYKPSGKVISIGYRFLPEYWGRGIATSCVHALLDYVQNHTGVELITAHVLPDNIASSRCLRKNGFEYLLTKTEDWGHRQLSIADVYTFDC